MKLLINMLLCLLVFVNFIHGANEPDESMILYMSFDTIDGKEVKDHSNYGNHGEIKGDPKHVEGKFGKALQLNGQDNWVEIPHHESLTVDKNVTVMVWINAERYTGPNDAQWQGILAKGNNPRSYSFYTDSACNCLHFSVGPPAGGGTLSEGKVELNVWQHVVAQIEDGTHRYWINGQKVGEAANKPDPPGLTDTSNVYIGTDSGGVAQMFLGLMDEVRIWNRALTEDEIVTQMDKGHFEIFPVDPRQKITTTWGSLKVIN